MDIRQASQQHQTSSWTDSEPLGEHIESPLGEHGPAGRAFRGTISLSDSQLEILDMLDDRRPTTGTNAPAATAARGRGFGVDVAFAALGSLLIGSGIILLFFFAALGSILLVSGAIVCAVAFEHVAVSEVADELALQQAAAAVTPEADTIV